MHLILDHADVLFVFLLLILDLLLIVLHHLVVAFLSSVFIFLVASLESVFFNFEETLQLV